MRRRLLLAAPLALGGCAALRRRRSPPAPAVHAVLGPPYQAGGVWRYPRTSYDGEETGLAVVAPKTPRGRLTSDGAPWDDTALMGAHPTLQLPCVVRVTNLETGRQILLRLDDRGPASPARLLAITPRAATLLGPGTEVGVLRVRLQVETGPSRALTAQLGDPEAPALTVVPAPVGAVTSETLAPPPGIIGRPAAIAIQTATLGTAAVPADPIPLRLPEAVALLPVGPTALWVDAGGLGQLRYAELLRDRLGDLGAVVVRSEQARPEVAWRVLIGPWPSVAAADAMLDRVLRAGVVDARIVVQ